MPLSDKAKLIALAIVNIFETGKPLGDYSAVAVLDDGAGVSYGISQFTHRSGSLLAVVSAYLAAGGSVAQPSLSARLPLLKSKNQKTINDLAQDAVFKQALILAAATPEMRNAQQQTAASLYLQPAIDACNGSHFELPLSLAVIYDSINHGSYERIRDKVAVSRSQFGNNTAFEKAWITDYANERDKWLKGTPRLKKTAYRTKFFLSQIQNGNWQLDLPVSVNGYKLTDAIFANSAVAPSANSALGPQSTANEQGGPASPQPPNILPPVEVKQQSPSAWVKIGAGLTFLTGSGLQVGALVQEKVSALTPTQILYLIAALGLCALAVWWYRKEAKGAQNRTLALIDKAADPCSHTVELTK
jgi:chitosanase